MKGRKGRDERRGEGREGERGMGDARGREKGEGGVARITCKDKKIFHSIKINEIRPRTDVWQPILRGEVGKERKRGRGEGAKRRCEWRKEGKERRE